jgi:hypothetical protein
MLTNWDGGVVRGTVENGKDPIDLEIPRHVSLILTSIDRVVVKTVEGQDESRFLTLEVRRTKEQELAIQDFIQNEPVDISEELKIIYYIWSIITLGNITIHKKVNPHVTNRELTRYRALLQCNALLNGRTTTIDQDLIDIDQFLSYSKPMIDNRTPAHKRDEDAIISILTAQWKNVDDIMKVTKLPYARVIRAIRGIKGTFDNPDGGLLESVKNLKMDYNPETRRYSFSLSFI